MGLTEKGYQRRSYDDILNDKILRAKELFGEDIDTSDLTPLGKFIRINAYDQALAEEEAEAIYYSAFPDTASGQSLDRLLIFAGINREPATAATFKVKFSGNPGAAVPVGFLVGTESGLTYYVTQEATIGDDGTCEATVDCTTAGEIGNENASAISVIVNPDVNILAVEGIGRLSMGQEEESDSVLRVRFKAAIQGAGSCNENAIRAALLRVPTVTSAGIIVNATDEVDENGRQPRSFECYVTGGLDRTQEIAETIFEKKPLGIKTHGSQSAVVQDEGGNDHVIRFSYTEEVVVSVEVSVKTDDKFEATGVEDIQSNVASYIDSLGVGTAVIFSSLYGCIYSVAGVKEVLNMTISTDGETYGTSNIDIDRWQIARAGEIHVIRRRPESV